MSHLKKERNDKLLNWGGVSPSGRVPMKQSYSISGSMSL